MDRQIKLRGFRVEPAEVEEAIRRQPGIEQAVVVLHVGNTGGGRLVAYVARRPESPTSLEDLRVRLRTQLPDYMVPGAFVGVDHFTLTANGKIDYDALPAPPVPEQDPVSSVEPRTPMQARIAAVWEQVLGVAGVGLDDSFFDIGGDSLAALEVFASIDSTLAVSLPPGTLFEASTVRALTDVVERAVTTVGAPGQRAIARIKNGTGPPLVCVHTISGDVFEYRDIARGLGADQPVIGFQAVIDDRVETLYASLEGTAAAYVDELRRAQPDGPYYLCGWSSGGTLALEMAQQLRAAGTEVALLAIIDNDLDNVDLPPEQFSFARLMRQVANVPGWIREDLLQSNPRKIVRRTRRRLSAAWRRLRRASEPETVQALFDFPPRPPAWERFAELHFQALKQYVPRRYSGRVSVFVAKTRPLRRFHDLVRAWRHMADTVEVYEVDGNHFSAVREPHVGVLASKLDQAIRAAQKPPRRGHP
jgi:thioesterase domain-containing protein/acyl carrier protein